MCLILLTFAIAPDPRPGEGCRQGLSVTSELFRGHRLNDFERGPAQAVPSSRSRATNQVAFSPRPPPPDPLTAFLSLPVRIVKMIQTFFLNIEFIYFFSEIECLARRA